MEIIAPGVAHIVDIEYCMAVDLAQQGDFTAVCIIEHRHHSHVTVKGVIIKEWDEYRVVHLERLPLGVDYVQQVAYLGQLFSRPPLNGSCPLLLDDTGVGKAVGDLAVAAGLNPIRVTITAGDRVTRRPGGGWNVSKGTLVSMLDAALHSQKFKIAKDLAEAPALREELVNFHRHVTASGRFSYEARATKHDDIVMACALGLFHFVGIPKHPPAAISRATYFRNQ
jgi:hypothetical protein